jgi:hypothetical protein
MYVPMAAPRGTGTRCRSDGQFRSLSRTTRSRRGSPGSARPQGAVLLRSSRCKSSARPGPVAPRSVGCPAWHQRLTVSELRPRGYRAPGSRRPQVPISVAVRSVTPSPRSGYVAPSIPSACASVSTGGSVASLRTSSCLATASRSSWTAATGTAALCTDLRCFAGPTRKAGDRRSRPTSSAIGTPMTHWSPLAGAFSASGSARPNRMVSRQPLGYRRSLRQLAAPNDARRIDIPQLMGRFRSSAIRPRSG